MSRVSSELVSSGGEKVEVNTVKMIGLAEINGHVFGLTPIILDEQPTQEFALVDPETGLPVIDPDYVRIGSRFLHSIGQIGTTDVIRQNPSPAKDLASLVRNFLVEQCFIREPVEAIVITLHTMETPRTTSPNIFGGNNFDKRLLPAPLAWTIRINVNTPPEELAKLGIPEIIERDPKSVDRSTEINLPRVTAYLFTNE